MKKVLNLFLFLVLVAFICSFYYYITFYSSSVIKKKEITSENPQESISITTPKHILEKTHHQAVTNSRSSNLNISKPSTNSVGYKYIGTQLFSGGQKTELVSAFFDFRDGRKWLAVLGCQNHHIKSSYHCKVRYPDGTEKCIGRQADQHLLSSGDENGSKKCWSYRFAFSLDDAELSPHPIAVSVSASSDCSSSSAWLNIIDRWLDDPNETKITFGVCYQTPLFKAGNLKGEILVESVERLKALGAEHFTFYFRETPSKEAMSVLKYYESENTMEIINMTISEATYYDVRYYGELIAIQDCIYRNMNRAKFLAMVDFDEVFVPYKHSNIIEMIQSMDSSSVSAFQFKHVAMMVKPGTELPTDMITCRETEKQILQPLFSTLTHRSPPFPVRIVVSVGRWKVILKPECVDRVGIHSVYGNLRGFHQASVPDNTGYLFHYRKSGFFDPSKCNDCVEDSRFTQLTPGLMDTYISRSCSLLQ